MRDFHFPGRSTAYGTGGMAATSHPLATMAAIDTLRDGGNAVDAALAAVAVQCVVEPAMTGIGGDCFVLFAPAKGGIVALNGAGMAPAGASIEAVRATGAATLGGTPHAITVPACLRAWDLLATTHGTKPLGQLLQAAIRHADQGFPVLSRVAHDWRRAVGTLELSEGGKDFYLPAGKAPPEGRIMRLPALARTLKKVAEHGVDAFYTGEVAQKMVRSLQGWGGFHTEEDFAAASAEFVDPVHSNYRDVQVYQCPPPGQGIITLMILNILEGYDMGKLHAVGAERLHLLAEAAKLAYRDRDAFLADPKLAEVPVARLLEKGYAAKLREVIQQDRALTDLPPPLLEAHPDTVYLTVVDKDLNAVSFINSVFDAFGSGLVCGETGVLFHNRGRAFRLDPSHPNALAPRKRPLHTIIPGMAFRGGESWLSFGVMGGQYQPVGQAHVLSAIVDQGMDPQEALDLPRATSYPTDMEVERGVGPVARAELLARGHSVVEPDSPLGGGQAILIDRKRGILVGGSDPRKDGLALGI